MLIFVAAPSGGAPLPLEVDATDTVADSKAKLSGSSLAPCPPVGAGGLFGATGQPNYSYAISHVGRRLDDDDTLAEHGVCVGSTIHIAPRLRGGTRVIPAGIFVGIMVFDLLGMFFGVRTAETSRRCSLSPRALLDTDPRLQGWISVAFRVDGVPVHSPLCCTELLNAACFGCDRQVVSFSAS